MNYDLFKDESSFSQRDIFDKLMNIVASQRYDLEVERGMKNYYKSRKENAEKEEQRLTTLIENWKEVASKMQFILQESHDIIPDTWQRDYAAMENYVTRITEELTVDISTETGE
jgi:DNA topoisomerase VI subunit B